jgi:hypothetical protein
VKPLNTAALRSPRLAIGGPQRYISKARRRQHACSWCVRLCGGQPGPTPARTDSPVTGEWPWYSIANSPLPCSARVPGTLKALELGTKSRSAKSRLGCATAVRRTHGLAQAGRVTSTRRCHLVHWFWLRCALQAYLRHAAEARGISKHLVQRHMCLQGGGSGNRDGARLQKPCCLASATAASALFSESPRQKARAHVAEASLLCRCTPAADGSAARDAANAAQSHKSYKDICLCVRFQDT